MLNSKIKNALAVTVEGADLTKATRIEFYLKQQTFFRQYTPTVTDETHMLVQIPFADAAQLDPAQLASVQMALTDEHGNARPTDVYTIAVRELLKEAGYA